MNNKKNFSFNKIFNKSLNNYRKISNISGVFFELNYSNNGEKLHLLSGSKKKKITEQALAGYVRILNLDIEYSIYDLYRYDNSYFTIAMYLSKINLTNLSNYFNKIGTKKIYKELKNNDSNEVFVPPEP